MSFIDMVRWEPKGAPLYAWKYPESNLSTMTQLLVMESQEAVLLSKGQLIGKFGPGKHALNTENLPLLRNLFGLPFGGNNPFTAEVWFVNKLLPLTIDWSTDSMMYHDPDYQTLVPLIAIGRYGLRVDDAERFIIKLVGTAPAFGAAQLTDHFLGALVSRTKTVLMQFMQSQRIGIKSISGYLDPLSESLKASMLAFWEDYGFSLIGFYITSIEIDSHSTAGSRILDAMSRQSAQLIGGYTWQQSQAFEVAERAVDSFSSGNGGLLGAVMMTGMMGGQGIGGGLLQPPAPGPQGGFAPAPLGGGAARPPRDVFCSNCAKKFSNSMKFCPHCGDPYTPCPHCGADNDTNASRCVSCGTPLSKGGICVNCNAPIPTGSAFCPTCGKSPKGSSGCARCGAALDVKTTFCPQCGLKVAQ